MASDAAKKTPLTEHPLDILNNIVAYLDAPSFLALCRTCKAFYSPQFRLDATYWRVATQHTFRVANRPVTQSDGVLWQKLYRRLLHNTCVYTWGGNNRGPLGQHDPNVPPPAAPGLIRGRGPVLRRGPRPRIARPDQTHGTPGEMFKSRELGIIADLQCGGWSTTLLNSKGVVYIVGVIDGSDWGRFANQAPVLTPLRFPPGFPQPGERYDPSVAIRQYSSGRSHVLGLSDSGKIWCWYDVNEPARNITFAEREIPEQSSNTFVGSPMRGENQLITKQGSVRKVHAGWGISSAYINGAGIILWTIANAKNYPPEAQHDTLEIQNSFAVPRTSYLRPSRSARDPDDTTRQLGETVGEVLNYIVIEHFVVFVTDLGKFFTAKISWNDGTGYVEDIVELVDLRDKPNGTADIQGSFRSFAAFRSGEVIISTQDYLHQCWLLNRVSASDHSSQSLLKRIPALQNSGVVSVTFGDYHYHALHSDGTISSYGKEPQGCGALGLGEGEAESRLRGVRQEGIDRKLIQHAYTTGRKIWFDQTRRKWITFLSSGGKDPAESVDRIRATTLDFTALAEVSEWIEQQGSGWDKEPDIAAFDEDGLGTHFALSVAAAGWHSGALVLVNEELAKKLEEKHTVSDGLIENVSIIGRSVGLWIWQKIGAADTVWKPPPRDPSTFNEPWNHGASPREGSCYRWAGDSFPRLRLSNGQEMPGTVPIQDWKYPCPEFELEEQF